MPRRALIDKRPYLMLSVAAAMLFYYLRVSELPEIFLWPIKGSACAFLAVYAWLRHSGSEARQVALAMTIAAIADMAVEFDLRVGAAIFVIFHIVMIRLFAAHSRGHQTGRDTVIFLALLMLPALIGYLLTRSTGLGWLTAIYAGVLGIMAAAAWASSFPRWTVAAGAMLFALSDLLIFAGLNPLAESRIVELMVWPIYYLGQFLMAVGVVTTMRKRHPELAVVDGGRAD